jgi:type VI secretion system FHA domain protein
MELILDIVKNGKNIPSKRNFHFDEEGGTIGRLESNNWVLTDPNSYISGLHATIICKQGTYFIKDESTNGTFLKNPYKKLPKGHPIKINASDVFIIGDHEIQARFSNNDYTDDDIISSIDDVPLNSDNIIPNDDFLFNSLSNEFTSVEESDSSEIDLSDFMLNEKPVVEDEEVEFIEAEETTFEEHINIPTFKEEIPEVVEEKREVFVPKAQGIEASIAILESKLGIEINALEQKDRDLLMNELGDIINNTLDSLKNSLEIKDKIQQNLHLSTAHLDMDTNNPVRLGSSATELLDKKNRSGKLGMMNISTAIDKSFSELNMHSIALHRSSKNLMNITLAKFSPKNLEHRFESRGALRGVLPKQQLLWKAYMDMFDLLHENPEEGIGMIQDEFKKEYENIAYSLKLQTPQTRDKI